MGWSSDHRLNLLLDCEKIYVPNLEGVRQLILGSVYSNLGKLDVAKQSYIKAMKAGEATNDEHTSAFAAYELGMNLCRNPEVTNVYFAFEFSRQKKTNENRIKARKEIFSASYQSRSESKQIENQFD